MRDYISREDAIMVAGDMLNSLTGISCKDGENTAREYFKCIPSTDIVEVDKVNKIYEKLADLLDIPCNYSPCDEIMFESERCIDDCGNISDAECWKRYFEVVCDGERADT